MVYMLLILETGERQTWSPEKKRRAYDRMMGFTEQLKTRGVYLGSESLRSTTERVRVDARGGKRIVTQGPFAESKEIVGGFLLVDCPSREQAVALASECPATEWASVEIREALQEPIGSIINALRESLERTPPELAADIVDRGIYTTGGGALLRGLDLLMREVTNLNIRVAQDPLTSVVLGAGKILEQPEDYAKVLLSGHKD